VAPIASCPPPRLASKDAGAGEARYGGLVDTRLDKFEIVSPPEGGIAMMLRMRSFAEAMERRLLVYSVKETTFGKVEGF